MVVVGVTNAVGVMVLVEVVVTTTTDSVTDATVATVTVSTAVGAPRHEQALETSEQAYGRPEQDSMCVVVDEVVVVFEWVIVGEGVGDTVLFVG